MRHFILLVCLLGSVGMACRPAPTPAPPLPVDASVPPDLTPLSPMARMAATLRKTCQLLVRRYETPTELARQLGTVIPHEDSPPPDFKNPTCNIMPGLCRGMGQMRSASVVPEDPGLKSGWITYVNGSPLWVEVEFEPAGFFPVADLRAALGIHTPYRHEEPFSLTEREGFGDLAPEPEPDMHCRAGAYFWPGERYPSKKGPPKKAMRYKGRLAPPKGVTEADIVMDPIERVRVQYMNMRPELLRPDDPDYIRRMDSDKGQAEDATPSPRTPPVTHHP